MPGEVPPFEELIAGRAEQRAGDLDEVGRPGGADQAVAHLDREP